MKLPLECLSRGHSKRKSTWSLCGDGAAAANAIASADYDLFLLDMDLPGEFGMRVLEVARSLGNGMRVLVLSAKADDLETRIACLEGRRGRLHDEALRHA